MKNLKVQAAYDTFYTIGFICFVAFISNEIAKWFSISGPAFFFCLVVGYVIYMMYASRLRDLEMEQKYPVETKKE